MCELEKPKFAIFAGVMSGMSFGMVLTGALSFVVLPVMVMLRPMSWVSRFKIVAVTASIGLGVFVLTNPYLPCNYLFHRSVVKSNVGNYGNFYKTPKFRWRV